MSVVCLFVVLLLPFLGCFLWITRGLQLHENGRAHCQMQIRNPKPELVSVNCMGGCSTRNSFNFQSKGPYSDIFFLYVYIAFYFIEELQGSKPSRK